MPCPCPVCCVVSSCAAVSCDGYDTIIRSRGPDGTSEQSSGIQRSDEAAAQVGRHQPEGPAAAGACARTTASAARTAWATAADQPAASVPSCQPTPVPAHVLVYRGSHSVLVVGWLLQPRPNLDGGSDPGGCGGFWLADPSRRVQRCSRAPSRRN